MRLRRDVLMTIVGIAVGAVVGGLIGWVTSHAYYLKALDDARADAKERQREHELTLRGIESIGTIKYDRDAKGKISGVVIELQAHAAASASATADISTAGDSASRCR
ncbi:MAG: hypothetical protein K2Y31_14205 [Burkholderiales bacterium]|nr:hypothetical protein [Burkholderiales bacterium]